MKFIVENHRVGEKWGDKIEMLSTRISFVGNVLSCLSENQNRNFLPPAFQAMPHRWMGFLYSL